MAFTVGDPAGIGPEIFQKFFSIARKDQSIEIVLIDDLDELNQIQSKIQMGRSSAFAGEYSFKTLERANRLALNNDYDYLITGPVAKESLWMADIRCSGQTELLAQINKLTREEIEMIFIFESFRILLGTRHIPICDVAQILELRLETVIKNGFQAMRNIFNIENPHIAVAGLNPHAGENGIIGLEENKFMKPIIKLSNLEGIKAAGPFPADSLFAQAAQKIINSSNPEYDLYVAAYHDQALPLIKGLGGLKAINLTYGLPYIRLSVDHGTGFDIVNRDLAKPDGLFACVEFCKKLKAKSFNA